MSSLVNTRAANEQEMPLGSRLLFCKQYKYVHVFSLHLQYFLFLICKPCSNLIQSDNPKGPWGLLGNGKLKVSIIHSYIYMYVYTYLPWPFLRKLHCIHIPSMAIPIKTTLYTHTLHGHSFKNYIVHIPSGNRCY